MEGVADTLYEANEPIRNLVNLGHCNENKKQKFFLIVFKKKSTH